MKELAKFQNWYVILKGENLSFHFEYKFVGHTWKLLKLYPTVHIYLFFYTLYCIVFTENHGQVEGVRKCTRRLFKVWRKLLKSKLICYSERGEPKLSFEYKICRPHLKTYKIIPNRTCISVFLHTVLHCFHWEHGQVEGVRSVHGGSLRYEEICQNQNWYVILKGENLSFHLNINLSATLEKLLKLYPTVHAYLFFLHTVLHCFHWEHRQVERVRSAHGGSLRYEGIGQIQNWYVILKGKNLSFHFEYKFVGHTWKLLKLYPTVHIYLFFYTLYCIVFTENTGKLKECEVYTEAL